MTKKPFDPWFKTTFKHTALGTTLSLAVPFDVFSTQRIDEGTLLLLENLPAGEPSSVLDVGCGYGALGLPIAARYPNARVELIDRDLLAVKWSCENARLNALTQVHAHGSLGLKNVEGRLASYDWILCNVPARIGQPFIEDLFASGRARLKASGELRVVVIRDLGPLLQELEVKHGWGMSEVARGPRHSVFSVPPAPADSLPVEPADLYLRDRVEVEGLQLDRPFDLGGDDPKRLSAGLPALLDALPRSFSGRVLCFRSSYGQVPLTCRKRWPDSEIVSVDRDLLGADFTMRNAKRLGLGGEKLELRECATLPEAISRDERFDLVLGELSSSAGEKVAESELRAIHQTLSRGGQALILCLEKPEREWVRAIASRARIAIHPMIRREGYVVLSFRASS